MYKGYYKNYRKRYKNYYNYNKPSILESFLITIFDAAFFLGELLAELIYKLFVFIFSKIKKIIYKPYNHISEGTNVIVNNKKDSFNNEIIEGVDEKSEQKYILKKSLLTPTEKIFSDVLEQIVDNNNYRIEHQVQLSRIVSVKDSKINFINYRDFNKIKAKSIDFVLFDKEDKPGLAIELDDWTHSRWDRIRRDKFVDSVMRDAGLPIVHIRVAHSYDPEKLKEYINQSIAN